MRPRTPPRAPSRSPIVPPRSAGKTGTCLPILDSVALLATHPLVPEHRVTRRQRQRGAFVRPDPPYLLMFERAGRSLHLYRHELDHKLRVAVSPAEQGLTDAGHVEVQLLPELTLRRVE